MNRLYKLLLVLCFVAMPSIAMAMQKDSLDIMKVQADSAYSVGEFDTAERIYLQLAGQGELLEHQRLQWPGD